MQKSLTIVLQGCHAAYILVIEALLAAAAAAAGVLVAIANLFKQCCVAYESMLEHRNPDSFRQ